MNSNASNWENIFLQKEWGKYPSIALVRFIASNYYDAQDRNEIKILEIGCGTGANLWYLAREGFMELILAILHVHACMKDLAMKVLQAK